MSASDTKPLLLNLETSGLTCGVALSHGDQILVEIAMHAKNIHSQKLAPFVDQLFKTSQTSPDSLQGILISAGPGSFTGLRIGFSLAKGIAHARNIPVIPVSTLAIWAFQLGPRPENIIPIIDARRDEIFVARFQHGADGFHMLQAPTRLPLPQLATWMGDDPAIITGSDALRLADKLQPIVPVNSTIYSSPAPQLWALAALGYQQFQTGKWPEYTEVEPQYMRAFKGVL